jgi:hypothetical protein
MNPTNSNSDTLQAKLLWAAVAALGAVSFGIVALNHGEAVNAAWLVVAAICIYFIAYRFYGLFVANRALGVDAARPTPAYRHKRRSRLRSHQPIRALWPSFRGHCRRRPAGRSGACRPDGLFAGDALDSRRGGVRWRSPGHDGPVSVDAAWRYVSSRR